jgi:hypothetical protein
MIGSGGQIGDALRTFTDRKWPPVITISAEQRAFADAFAELIGSVDESGRLMGNFARERLATLLRIPVSARAAVLQDPERYFGSFDALPANGQRAILDAIRVREAWQTRGCQVGRLHLALVRSLFRLRNLVRQSPSQSRISDLLRQIADAAAYGARRAPADLISGVSQLQSRLKGRYGYRPAFSAILSAADIDPRPLAVCYARPMEQLDGYRGYWHEAASARTVGIVIGIDFLPTDEGFRYVESNVTFAQRPERSALYEVDPFVENMLDFATQNGYRHLMLADGNSNGIDPRTAERYERGARARNLQLTLIDRENVPNSKYACRYSLPPIDTRDTLLLRTKAFPVALDYVAGMKNANLQALRRYQASEGDVDLLLPQSGVEPVLGQVELNEPFPNVVYKLPELDQARGVYFLKAESAEHAKRILTDAFRASASGSLQARLQKLLSNRNGFYQAYYKSKMGADRCLYIVRAHVLITPVGVRFLSAHQVISGTPVPTELPSGIVEDSSPFMVNYSAGSRYALLPQDEGLAVARASEAVGRGLAWAFQYGFRVN